MNSTIAKVYFQHVHVNLQYMKYLGVDYGTKRVGLAISDEDGNFAFPYGIVENKKVIKTIENISKKEKIDIIILGNSNATNGYENDISNEINSFKSKLALAIETSIFLEREDFSSFEAHRYQEKKGHRDDSAAAIILQRFLDKKKK